MDRREVVDVSRSPITGAGKPLVKPDNAMHFLHDNCAAIAQLSTRLRIVADNIVGSRPSEVADTENRIPTVLNRLEDQAFMLSECFDELCRIERGLGVKNEGAGIEAGR
jgi:hypothetical protein